MSCQLRGVLGVLLALLATARGAFPNYTMSDMDLKTAAGYYNGNGKYLGGIPEVSEVNCHLRGKGGGGRVTRRGGVCDPLQDIHAPFLSEKLLGGSPCHTFI